ncbi:MAG: RagB/SusD family nutrient uptake outer membrane protein, partial [Tannerellaceae bacterium]|nr:RagB/SusD family nutrient uptake outer membrane protein [Tannerellaceae bacterium]
MKKYINKILCVAIAWTLLSCSSFLDVVPDNVPSIDHAFQNRGESEKYLVGLYSYMPVFTNTGENPALTGAVEEWRNWDMGAGAWQTWQLACNAINSNDPYSSYFEGTNNGKPYYRALRDINIFLENIHKPYDLEDWERQQWVAEALFLKAYYHFWLFRMYGPIPLVPDNITIDEEAETVQRYRDPVDSCVNFIASLLDRAIEGLPSRVSNEVRDLGKPTKVVALAVKAQLLTYAASPLFNGNTDYADYIDARGIQLFPQEYDASKWQRAADALKKAIDAAHDVRMELYDFRTAASSMMIAQLLSDETINAMQVR